MVNVVAVGHEHAAGLVLHAVKRAPRHGNQRVGDRQPEDEDRQQRGESSRQRRAAPEREGRKAESDRGRPGVAQEQPRRMDVVGKESQQRAGEDQRDAGHAAWPTSANTAAMLSAEINAETGREAVEAVDDVERVRYADDPEGRERRRNPANVEGRAEHVHFRRERDAQAHRDGRAEHVREELGPRADRPDVVDDGDQQDRQDADADAGDQVRRHLPAAGREPRRRGEDSRDGADDGQAAEARNGVVCTLRSPGKSMAPTRMANRATSGVSANAVPRPSVPATRTRECQSR